MTAPVDKRDWLVAKGLAKPGRGKFSNAAKEALAEAERAGTRFIDKGTTLSTVTVIDENGERQTERREVNQFAHHPEPIRTDARYTFVGEGTKKTRKTLSVSVTEACAHCSYSLGWCYCEIPTFTYWKTGEVLRLA